MHLMADFKFERSLNDLFCDFAADILNFIVCANKKAILPQFYLQTSFLMNIHADYENG